MGVNRGESRVPLKQIVKRCGRWREGQTRRQREEGGPHQDRGAA